MIIADDDVLLTQGESEERMLRVLYYIRFLRSLIFNAILGLLAIGVYLLFGFQHLYPGTEDLILALKAAPNSVGVVPIVVGISLILPVFFFISYLSLTRIWRKTLKAQAIFYCLGIAALIPSLVADAPVVANSDRTFAGLFILCIIFLAWVVLDITYALWRASRTPEISSFRAVLDTRLHSGAWSLANKLLDLPRSPLRSRRAFGCYLLSLAGAVGVVLSVLSLSTFGGVFNRAASLATVCRLPSPECSSDSRNWALSTFVWLAVAVLALRVSLTAQAFAKKRSALAVRDVLKAGDSKYILYLRSFGTDDVVLPKPKFPLLSRILSPWPFPTRVEEELFDVADGYMPLIAVGRPGFSGESEGGVAYREFLPDDAWRGYVADKIAGAAHVIFLLSDTPGLLWELAHALSLSAAPRTIFMFDPKAKNPEAWRRIVEAVRPVLVEGGFLPGSFAFAPQSLAFYFDGPRIVQVVNPHWSVTSYRTAFSEFLSAATRRSA